MIKKSLFIGFTLFASIYSIGQKTNEGFKQGDKIISGLFEYSSEKTGDSKTTSVELSPSFGYFVSDKVLVGANIGVSNSTTKVKDLTTNEEGGYHVRAFGRYYFNPSNKFSVFGHANLGFGVLNDKVGDVKTENISMSVSPGISYFLSDHFAIETTIGNLGFSSEKPDDAGAESTNHIDFGLNLTTTSFALIYKF